MAENFYHKILKQELKYIAGNSEKYKYIGIEQKQPIAHPNQELVIHYKPEALFITKRGKKHIFEVLDDQIGDYNLILSDIVQCFLIENVAKVIFISKNEEGAILTNKLSRIIGAILEKKGYFKREIPEVFVYTISYQEAKSRNIRKILIKYGKQDGWCNAQ